MLLLCSSCLLVLVAPARAHVALTSCHVQFAATGAEKLTVTKATCPRVGAPAGKARRARAKRRGVCVCASRPRGAGGRQGSGRPAAAAATRPARGAARTATRRRRRRHGGRLPLIAPAGGCPDTARMHRTACLLRCATPSCSWCVLAAACSEWLLQNLDRLALLDT